MLADDIFLYIENPESSTKFLLGLINEFSKVARYKITCKIYLCCYTLIINYEKKKLRKQSHLQYHKKIHRIYLAKKVKDLYTETIGAQVIAVVTIKNNRKTHNYVCINLI